MFQHILVPLDGSLQAERAIPVAARLARASEGMVILLRVVKAAPKYRHESSSGAPIFQTALQSEWDEAQQYLTGIAASHSLAGLPLSVALLQGSVVASIQATIQTDQADLLVCCEQPIPQGSHCFLGTFAEQLSQHLSIPLFLLPMQETLHDPSAEPKEPLTCLVAFAGSQPEPFLIHPAAALVAALADQKPGHLHFAPLYSVVFRSTRIRSAQLATAASNGHHLSARRSAVLDKEVQTDEQLVGRGKLNQGDVLILATPLFLEQADLLQDMCAHSRLFVPTPIKNTEQRSSACERSDTMFQRILIPLDGSPGAERAIPVAARLVCAAGGALVFLHIVAGATDLRSTIARAQRASDAGDHPKEASPTEAIEKVMNDAASYLAKLPVLYAEDLASIPTEMEIAFGSASPALPSTARLEHVDLIVLCSHQEMGLGQWGLESITQQVMRPSPVPLLILNEHEQEMPTLDGAHSLRVLVPLDGSLFAETALTPALQLRAQCAEVGQRELCLLHVVDLFAGDSTRDEEAHMSQYTTEQARQNARHYLHAIADRLRHDAGKNVSIICRTTSGVDIVSTLLKEIKQTSESEQAPSLLAMATHGREGMQRQIMGSVAERLLNSTTTPLLTICPREATASWINFALPVQGENEKLLDNTIFS